MDRTETFSEIGGFGEIISHMDTYKKLPLTASDESGGYRNEKVFGMINTTRRHVTMAVGKQYPVFDHRTAYGMIANELENRKVPCHGKIQTVGDRVYADIVFDEAKHMKEPGTDGLDVGISFSNPMDIKTSFKGSGYTYRIVCANGMRAKSLLPSMEISEWHTSNMLNQIPSIIAKFVEASLNQTNHLEYLMKKSMETKMVFINREELEATMANEFTGIADRHLKGVLKEIKTLEPTRWDMFNASTFYSSHHGLSREVTDKLDTISEKFLNVSKPIPIVNPALVKLQAMM
jgi:hypothetical protein